MVDTDASVLRIGEIGLVPLKRVRFFQDQPRTYFNPEDLQSLARGIKQEEQQNPVWVKLVYGNQDYDYELIDGERRYRAIEIGGIDEILVIVKEIKSLDDQYIKSVIGNFGHQRHKHIEVAQIIKRIMAMPDIIRLTDAEKIRRITNIFSERSESFVYQHFCLLKLSPKVLEMMDESIEEDKRLSFSIAFYLSSLLNQDLQLSLARQIVDKGMKLKRARIFIRLKAEEAGEKAGNSKRGRRPSDYAKLLERLLQRICEDSDDLWSEMPKETLERFLRGKSKIEVDQLRGSLLEAKNRIEEIEETINNTYSQPNQKISTAHK